MAHLDKPVLGTDVFQMGNIKWKQFNVETSTDDSSSPPQPLLIFTPTVPGSYPVIMFVHGFFVFNSYYSAFLSHIVSHGFIIVAPQLVLDVLLPIPPEQEVEYAGKVVDWITEGLQPLLPESVEANLKQLVLSGHSRGGKTAFDVALGHAKTNVKFSALVGIDPVAGLKESERTPPLILTGVPHSFNLNMPVEVIGSGLGPEKANILFPPCAPDGMNYKEFFNECKPPCANFVVTKYGHMDLLNDDCPGIIGAFESKCVCKDGTGPRDLMRRTLGGLVVSFLRAQLNDLWKEFDAILKDPGLAPTELDNVVYLPA